MPVESPASSPDLRRLKDALNAKYTGEATHYDAERAVSRRARYFFDSFYAALNALIGPTHSETVHLDMPVGTGRFLEYLRDHGRAHRMIGLDVSPGMLGACGERFKDRTDAVALGFGDAFSIPLRDGSVDIVTALRFFHLFPKQHWPALIAEMYRVLKPGGILLTEMRSGLRGVGVAVYKEYRDRWLNDDSAHYFLLPGQVRGLFADFELAAVRGVGLDGLEQVARIAPRLATLGQRTFERGLLGYLNKEVIVKARKPVSS